MPNAFRGIDWGWALDELSTAISEQRPPRYGTHAAHVVEILDAVETSRDEGRAVELTSTFPPSARPAERTHVGTANAIPGVTR